jgi:hypothetical protein
MAARHDFVTDRVSAMTVGPDVLPDAPGPETVAETDWTPVNGPQAGAAG